jgi:hypothetical protein
MNAFVRYIDLQGVLLRRTAMMLSILLLSYTPMIGANAHQVALRDQGPIILAQATPNPQPGPAPQTAEQMSRQPLGALSDSGADGFWIGESDNGVRRAYNPQFAPLSSVPAIQPDAGFTRTGGDVIFVNGLQNKQSDAANAGQLIANKTGGNVRVFYNATQGLNDIPRAIGDNLNILGVSRTPATKSLGSTIYFTAKAGKALHIMSTSHGSILTRNALYIARERLLADFGYREIQFPGVEHGLNPTAYQQQLQTNNQAFIKSDAALRNIKIETFGSGTGKFDIPGPKFLHWVNTHDPVVDLSGISYQGNAAKLDSLDPGVKSVVYRFTSGTKGAQESHYMETYLPARIGAGSFDQIYDPNSGKSGNVTIVDRPGTKIY